MGFKRTADGRIFFQGSDKNNDNDTDSQTKVKNRSKSMRFDDMGGEATSSGSDTQYTQVEILKLLKTLNERLQSSQSERAQIREDLEKYSTTVETIKKQGAGTLSATDLKMIEDQLSLKEKSSEKRAERAEKIARDTLKELEETRKLLSDLEEKNHRSEKKINALTTLQQDQVQKLATTAAHYAAITKRLKETELKSDALNLKLEDVVGEQERLFRKVDKALEQRARFMRKIERIEETVLQTRDALNAKAMVLLTDQDVPERQMDSSLADLMRDDMGDNEQQYLPKSPVVKSKESSHWANKVWMLIGAITVMAVIGGMIWYTTISSDSNDSAEMTSFKRLFENEQLSDQTLPPPENLNGSSYNQSRENDVIETNTLSTMDTARTSESETTDQISNNLSINAYDDIGTVPLDDGDALLNALENNPERLAQQLNAIEPGTPPQAEQKEEMLLAQDLAAEPQIETPEIAEQPTLNKPPASPQQSQVYASQNKTYSTHDSRLPEQLITVENQAIEGSAEAQHDLAAIYTAGHAGAPQDYSRALYWFEQAANQGIANAAYNLGVLHHQGLGTSPDLSEAIIWYQKAADLDHPEAKYNLGIGYIEGLGVPYNPQKAASYFESAARNGVVEAAYNLGLIYENGLLGAPAPDQALLWYKTAADNGSQEARSALNQLAENLDISIDDVNRLVEDMRTRKEIPMKKPESSSVPSRPQTSNTPSSTQTRPAVQNTEQSAASNASQIQSTTQASNSSQPPQQQEQGNQQALIAQIQRYMMESGFYPGPADGNMGPLTSDAIRSFQAYYNLPVTGLATSELLFFMRSNLGNNQ